MGSKLNHVSLSVRGATGTKPQQSTTYPEHCICLSGALSSSYSKLMMTVSNGNIFCVIGPLWGESPVTGGFPLQRSVALSFDVFFGLRLNKPLNEQSRRRWFETPSRSLWRQCNHRHSDGGCRHDDLRCSSTMKRLSIWQLSCLQQDVSYKRAATLLMSRRSARHFLDSVHHVLDSIHDSAFRHVLLLDALPLVQFSGEVFGPTLSQTQGRIWHP